MRLILNRTQEPVAHGFIQYRLEGRIELSATERAAFDRYGVPPQLLQAMQPKEALRDFLTKGATFGPFADVRAAMQFEQALRAAWADAVVYFADAAAWTGSDMYEVDLATGDR
jgi:hypothetical protein